MEGMWILGLLLLMLGIIIVSVFNNLESNDVLAIEEPNDFDEGDNIHDTTTMKGRQSKAKEIITVIKAKLRPEDVGSFELYKDKAEEFRFRLFDAKGNNILMSEGYKRKSNCLNGIKSVKKNAIDSSKFAFSKSKDKKDYFTLRATNGRTLGKSQFFGGTEEALEAMDLVIIQAVNDATINDLT